MMVSAPSFPRLVQANTCKLIPSKASSDDEAQTGGRLQSSLALHRSGAERHRFHPNWHFPQLVPSREYVLLSACSLRTSLTHRALALISGKEDAANNCQRSPSALRLSRLTDTPEQMLVVTILSAKSSSTPSSTASANSPMVAPVFRCVSACKQD